MRGTYRRRQQVVPYIRLSGAWLQHLGFRRGARIEITEERGRLVLTVVREAAHCQSTDRETVMAGQPERDVVPLSVEIAERRFPE